MTYAGPVPCQQHGLPGCDYEATAAIAVLGLGKPRTTLDLSPQVCQWARGAAWLRCGARGRQGKASPAGNPGVSSPPSQASFASRPLLPAAGGRVTAAARRRSPAGLAAAAAAAAGRRGSALSKVNRVSSSSARGSSFYSYFPRSRLCADLWR